MARYYALPLIFDILIYKRCRFWLCICNILQTVLKDSFERQKRRWLMIKGRDISEDAFVCLTACADARDVCSYERKHRSRKQQFI